MKRTASSKQKNKPVTQSNHTLKRILGYVGRYPIALIVSLLLSVALKT